MQDVTYSCDSATGDLYENRVLVGKLITGSSGAWLNLVKAANCAYALAEASQELLVAQQCMQHVSDYYPGERRRRLDAAQEALRVAHGTFIKEAAV